LAVVSGYLFDTTVNIFHMVFGGLLDCYPMLKLCCTHAGGYALSLRGRMHREIDTNPALAARLRLLTISGAFTTTASPWSLSTSPMPPRSPAPTDL
jgi:hypothetical protein